MGGGFKKGDNSSILYCFQKEVKRLHQHDRTCPTLPTHFKTTKISEPTKQNPSSHSFSPSLSLYLLLPPIPPSLGKNVLILNLLGWHEKHTSCTVEKYTIKKKALALVLSIFSHPHMLPLLPSLPPSFLRQALTPSP